LEKKEKRKGPVTRENDKVVRKQGTKLGKGKSETKNLAVLFLGGKKVTKEKMMRVLVKRAGKKNDLGRAGGN